MHAKSLQLCPTLWDPMDCSLPGSSGILQARILEWVARPSSRGSPRPRDQTWISCISGGFFTGEPPGKLNWPLYIPLKFTSSFMQLFHLILPTTLWGQVFMIPILQMSRLRLRVKKWLALAHWEAAQRFQSRTASCEAWCSWHFTTLESRYSPLIWPSFLSIYV